MSDRDEQIARVNAVAEMLGVSPEQLLAAALNMGAEKAVGDAGEDAGTLPPPPIVYPNVKFPPYKFREYPKIAYRGYIRDLEETVTKLTPKDGGGVEQRTFVRVIPDQFVEETRMLQSKAEENTMPKGWFLKREEAIEAAHLAKATQRPIVEREIKRRGRPPKPVEDEENAENPMQETVA